MGHAAFSITTTKGKVLLIDPLLSNPSNRTVPTVNYPLPHNCLLDDDEYSELQQFLMQNPNIGDVIPGSGGVRKLRWARAGMGKRGGLRIIYYVRHKPNEFWMLTLYAKAESENVPTHILKQLLEAFRDD